MQSSSDLFPVSLVSAELRGDLIEDVYRLKPGNSPDSSVELALTRLSVEGGRGVPVILLHGSFSNRRFWYSPKGLGLGPYLARAGFDVWIAEMRGHGLSPRNRQYKTNSVEDYARYDLPAIGAFVREQSGQAPHWLGHSLGGITLAAALGAGFLDPAHAASAAVFGSQVSQRHWLLRIAPVRWLISALLLAYPYVSGRRLKRGPEDEPIGVAREVLRWQGKRWSFRQSKCHWWQGLAEIKVPMLVVAGAGDQEDPPWACQALLEQTGQGLEHFVLLGKAQGYLSDYGHIEMLVSKGAQTEVWPLTARWLQDVQQQQQNRAA